MDNLTNSLLINTVYDIAKFFVAYLLGRGFYDGIYKKMRWGGWQAKVVKGEELLSTRPISLRRAELILDDDNELSVYIKGIVSFHDWLNMDICSDEAKTEKLLIIDRKKKEIIVDLLKNPPPKEKEGMKKS
uniref:hypothetical protein n=1 Tax=Candidatus Electrothrix sp. TaxID=2170559 RepID=UPI00405786C1